ncbi:MAG: prepilin-type N-terminal cleavage/methylation domain-containing protein [Lachnospiraceae bacterium]|nr:prepilin-type N-terminal cleavage/methylation domain-containing protein [Lachnospiraceae bacterium]
MSRQMNKNQGFSLIELLISMALLSIVMLMVVQFMSTTTMANKKTRNNLEVQTEASMVMLNLEDTLVTATYVSVSPWAYSAFELENESSISKDKREDTRSTASLTTDLGAGFSYDLVPDYYGEYCKSASATDERRAIVNMDTYQLAGKAKGTYYPLSGDIESGNKRSFRVLQQGGTNYYIIPGDIYVEYYTTQPGGDRYLNYAIYRLLGNGDGTFSLYMYRSPENEDKSAELNRFLKARAKCTMTGDEGLLTKHLQDFYMSADADGNALIFNFVSEVGKYKYNVVQTVKFRNSNVLTVSPQKLFKEDGTGIPTP